jgi:TldD protein
MSLKTDFVGDIPRRKFLELGLKGGVALASTPSLLRGLLSGQTPAGQDLPLDDLNKVIRHALGKGGEFGEVYVEHRISRSILLEEGKFKSAVFGISQGAGVRVISGDKTGYAYTDEITQEKLIGRPTPPRLSPGRRTVKPVDIKRREAVLHHGQVPLKRWPTKRLEIEARPRPRWLMTPG